jgi:act minimal PKS chain-length factor (CLF/KS beta)
VTGPAVFTGVGVVAPSGIGVEEYWAATLAGRSAIGPITRFDVSGYPTTVAGQIDTADLERLVPSRLAVQTDRWTHFALIAAEQALTFAGLDPTEADEYRLAVVTASSSGGNEFGQREIGNLWSAGPGYVGAYQSIAWFYAATTGQLSIRHGMRGCAGVLVTEQAGGLDAAGEARRAVARGATAVLTGGTEAPLSPYALVCQLSSALLSTTSEPALAYLPFSVDACGHVPGEGGAILLVEEASALASRDGPKPLGRIAGYAATFDPRPDLKRPPALRRAIELALADARLAPGDVDLVIADGAGTRVRDREEAEAIAAVFGPYGVPVTVPKSMVGRLYAGAAPLDLVCALLTMRDGVIPPTVGVTAPAPDCPIDLVCGQPRSLRVRTVLVLARGYGGFNAAMVLAAADQRRGDN